MSGASIARAPPHRTPEPDQPCRCQTARSCVRPEWQVNSVSRITIDAQNSHSPSPFTIHRSVHTCVLCAPCTARNAQPPQFGITVPSHRDQCRSRKNGRRKVDASMNRSSCLCAIVGPMATSKPSTRCAPVRPLPLPCSTVPTRSDNPRQIPPAAFPTDVLPRPGSYPTPPSGREGPRAAVLEQRAVAPRVAPVVAGFGIDHFHQSVLISSMHDRPRRHATNAPTSRAWRLSLIPEKVEPPQIPSGRIAARGVDVERRTTLASAC